MTPPPLYLRQNPKQKQFFDAFPIATLAFQSEHWLAEDEITLMSKIFAQILLGTALKILVRYMLHNTIAQTGRYHTG